METERGTVLTLCDHSQLICQTDSLLEPGTEKRFDHLEIFCLKPNILKSDVRPFKHISEYGVVHILH